jgi:putative DNA primase/helicase
MTAIAPDIEQARSFLELLDPDADGFTFQTFDDSELKRGHLAKVCHGPIEEEAARLTAWSQSGAGVFVTVNETNGMGRKEENIVRARAVFVDLDGSPLQPVLACLLEPHIIVESSPGRWHAYGWSRTLRSTSSARRRRPLPPGSTATARCTISPA